MRNIKTFNIRLQFVLFGVILMAYLCQPICAQTTGTIEREAVAPELALETYIDQEDGAFTWEVIESSSGGRITIYHLLLTSQRWREHLWQHQLTIFVPQEIQEEGALLFITGGSHQEDGPKWVNKDGMWPAMAAMAEKNQAIVSILRKTPNQPLYNGKSEDELISFYYSDIPGQNMIHYVPNAGHNLGGGEQALKSLNAFFGLTLEGRGYPVSTWEINSNDSSSNLIIHLDDPNIVKAEIWSANSMDMDFRDEKWQSKSLGKSNTSTIEIQEIHPHEGFKAFYVDMIYKDSQGDPFSVSTRRYVLDAEGLK